MNISLREKDKRPANIQERVSALVTGTQFRIAVRDHIRKNAVFLFLSFLFY